MLGLTKYRFNIRYNIRYTIVKYICNNSFNSKRVRKNNISLLY